MLHLRPDRLDNVGNSAAITTTVQLDTSPPSAPITNALRRHRQHLRHRHHRLHQPPGRQIRRLHPRRHHHSTPSPASPSSTSPPSQASRAAAATTPPAPYTTTYAWTGAVTATGTQTLTATNTTLLTATSTITVTPDTTAPTTGALTVNGSRSHSRRQHQRQRGNTTFTIGTRTDYTDPGSGLTSSILTRKTATLTSSNGILTGTCGSFGTATTITGNPGQTLTSPACYQFTLTGLDNVGNSAAITTTVQLDTSPPSAPTPTLSAATGNTYITGTTAYINPQAGKTGGFTLTATTLDNDSGLTKLNFPTLTGFTSGGGDDTTSPYTTTYAWTGAVTATGTQTLTATNTTLLTATNTITITPDTTAPTTGALTVNGTAATAGGSTSVSGATTFTIGTRTDYTDPGSGLTSSILTRKTATLTSSNGILTGTCGSFGTATTITGNPGQTLTSPACYQFTLTGLDNVGNSAAITTTVQLDTSPPSAPTPTLSAATGNTYITGTTAYINPQAGKTGGFTLTATTLDNDSGLTKLNFPTLTGFTSGGGDDTTSPYTTTYAWTGAVTATGTQTLTATNTTLLTATNTITITPDTTAPTTGALTVNGQTASGAGTTSSESNTILTIGTRTDYTDSGSGLASSILTVQSETLTAGSCGTAGSGGSYPTPTTITGTTSPVITAGFCYLFTLAGTDRVGNSAAVSTTVLVTPTPDLSRIEAGHSCSAGGCGWAVGNGGTIDYTSTGTSFDSEVSGTSVNLNDATSPADNAHVWVVGDGGTILECTTSCQTPGSAVWTKQTSNTTANLYSIAGADNSNVWAVGAGGVIDFWNGSTWALQQSGKSYDLLDIGGSTTGTGWAVGTGGTILVTTNGTTWTAQTAPSIAGSTTYDLQSVDAGTASTAWAVGAGGAIIYTTNTGATWTSATSPTTNMLYEVVATGTSARTTSPVYAVGGGGVILDSTNGTTFTAQTSTTSNDLLGAAAFSGSTLLAVGATGTILHTTTTGTTWSAVPAPFLGLSPSTGVAGITVTVTGSGFAASSAVTAKFNGSAVTLGGVKTTTSAGVLTGATFTVPGSLTAGSTYGVLFTDAAGNTAATSFTAR